MPPASLVVVIPAYDEIENLRVLVPQIRDVLAKVTARSGLRWAIHVIQRVTPHEADEAELRALGAVPFRREPTDSFGDAIRSGIASVPGDVDAVIFMDADGSHRPAVIPLLLASHGDHDVVVASRYVHGGRSDNNIALRTMSRSLNTAYRLVLGIPCHDVSTNFKCYRRDQLQAITLECDKFDVVEEILFRLQQHIAPEPLRIDEIPDYFHERQFGDSKRQLGPFVASYLVTLARLRLSARGSSDRSEP